MTSPRREGQLPEPLYSVVIHTGVRHVAAAVLAAQSGYCRDYIAHLARQGRIDGRRLGTQWYIDERSFWTFFLDQERLHEERRRQLAARRRLEYQAAQSASAHSL